jgi:predicted nucleic acid-binding protein
MPDWLVPEQVYDLPRRIALLDTNVLIALVDPRDNWHDHTVAAIDLGEFKWVVTYPSLIEAWNLLVGRQRRLDLAYELMNWIFTPRQAILLGDAIEPVATAHSYSQRFRIDLVDASLIDLADRMSRECDLNPSVHVATYDTGDFTRLLGIPGLNFNVYDMRDITSTTGFD